MKEQDYRNHAKQAREMAATMRTDDDRRFWLNLATLLEQFAHRAAGTFGRMERECGGQPGRSHAVHRTMSNVSKAYFP
jgi:hypothetical protein